MTERVFLVLAAFIAGAAVLIALDVLLSIWWDMDMRRRKSLRAFNSPSASGNGSARRPASPRRAPNREPWGKR